MRLLRSLLVCLCIIMLLSVTVYAHPGRTDGNGGHTNHNTGEYHYHHGYSAHDHYDMDDDGKIDCPYAFDDKTSHDPSDSYPTKPSYTQPEATQPTTAPTNIQAGNSNANDWKGLLSFLFLPLLVFVAYISFRISIWISTIIGNLFSLSSDQEGTLSIIISIILVPISILLWVMLCFTSA